MPLLSDLRALSGRHRPSVGQRPAVLQHTHTAMNRWLVGNELAVLQRRLLVGIHGPRAGWWWWAGDVAVGRWGNGAHDADDFEGLNSTTPVE